VSESTFIGGGKNKKKNNTNSSKNGLQKSENRYILVDHKIYFSQKYYLIYI